MAAARTTTAPEPSATTPAQPDEPPATERPPDPGALSDRVRQNRSVIETKTKKPEGTSSATSTKTRRANPVQGQEYTWYDGDRVERVHLQSDLVVQPSSANTDDDVVARDDGESSIVQTQARHGASDTAPVFRSQAGNLMTLPGGVLLALDADWDEARVNRFFADNGIDRSRVQSRDWAVNAFFVETEPGFPSLNLANELAAQEGVHISIPNWQTEVSLR